MAMRTGRRLSSLHLTGEECETLERWMRFRKTSQALAQRARLVLACVDGRSNLVVAATLQITPRTVGKWRGRFIRDRLDGLLDEPRPGLPGGLPMADRARRFLDGLRWCRNVYVGCEHNCGYCYVNGYNPEAVGIHPHPKTN